jgi:hypothetical protein
VPRTLVLALSMLALVGAAVGVCGGAEIEGVPADDVAALRKLDSVEGSAVGYAGDTGRFTLIAERVVARGTLHGHLRMTQDQQVIVRSMGLLCVARRLEPAAAARVLRGRLRGRQTFTYFPGGCVGQTYSEGAFARALLHGGWRSFLKDDGLDPWDPEAEEFPGLVEPRELASIDLEVLASDECHAFHDEAARWLAKRLPALAGPGYDLAALRALEPGLPRFLLVKAVGRMAPGADTRRVLVGALADPRADAVTRLAAGSGLTRDADRLAGEALRRHRAALDALEPGGLGTVFCAEHDRRVRHAAVVTRFEDAMRTEEVFHLATRQTAMSIASNDHPMALPDLVRGLGYSLGDHVPKYRQAITASVLRIADEAAGRLHRHWDTHSDTAYAIERLLPPRDRPDGEVDFNPLFTPAEVEHLRRAVEPYIDERAPA